MNDKAETTRFILVRHAQTKWNQMKLIQGMTDSPLTPEGVQAARSWGAILKEYSPDRMICSPLNRAVDTAVYINEALDLPLSQDVGFLEQSWGRWEGKTLAEIKEESPVILQSMVDLGWEFSPPGGESRISVMKRCIKALQRLHEKWTGQTIIIVAHRGVIACIMYHLLGRAFLPSEPSVLKKGYAQILTCDGAGLTIEALNGVALK
ncbi:probable phosphoglycerate mutase [Desulfatibacillum alkenivorans DSM 16219]|jgi:probable phosphoglycerate mutase|uniref:Probable phosphoglycerate mutase n=1 Tax=Desulfatibacillum alkenivorans DSM 16219 TaxID=1121393 RepID=A0A1M6PD49_9BACT|nr:histidine phosphatase family protein [Desulfatibacillum alkenivorans]SHK05866.1 probable phosphoglycerate mutase [Desulfatibacillum alkenivorans DSM 16219]